MKSRQKYLFSLLFSAILLMFTSLSNAATIATDGGITLYVSCSNLDVPGGVSWNSNITQSNSNTGTSCVATNSTRSFSGENNSPGACPGGNILAWDEKIFQYTDGQHY